MSIFHIIFQIKILIFRSMSRYACNSIVYHILTYARSHPWRFQTVSFGLVSLSLIDI